MFSKDKWHKFISEIVPNIDISMDDISLLDSEGDTIEISLPKAVGCIRIGIMKCMCMERKYHVELSDNSTPVTPAEYDHIPVEQVRLIVEAALQTANMYYCIYETEGDDCDNDRMCAAVKVTPCCRSRHWHLVNRSDVPDGVIRCELCNRMHDYEGLLI